METSNQWPLLPRGYANPLEYFAANPRLSLDKRIRILWCKEVRPDGTEIMGDPYSGERKFPKYNIFTSPSKQDCKTKKELSAWHSRERLERIRRATPSWANIDKIKSLYKKRDLMNRKLPITEKDRFVVDHIVPLTSKVVCGFHVENNLQIIRKSINSGKYNTHRYV